MAGRLGLWTQCTRFFTAEATSVASGHSDVIRSLRERTGAPIKDVKQVLVQCGWNQDVAFTELRKKGLAAATKKSSRVAAEGLLGVAQTDNAAAIIEINSETDFVSRNDLFQHLVLSVAKAASSLIPCTDSAFKTKALNLEELEAVKVFFDHPKLNGDAYVRDAVKEVAAITGENVKLRRGFIMTAPHGIVSTYMHCSPMPGLARLAGMVSVEVEGGLEGLRLDGLKGLGSSLAMHIVASRPLYVSKDRVDSEVLEQERNICRSQSVAANKPANVIEKMVEGRLSKYIEDVVLLEQRYVEDETKKVKVIVEEVAKDIGRRVSIGSLYRMEVGEGIERLDKDFAAEVKAAAQ